MKIVIVGAGASGLFASILAKEKFINDEVVVLDKNNKVAKKMYACGNGKCNIGNLNIKDNSYNSKIVTKLINKVTPQGLIEFYESHGISVINDGDLLYPSNLSAETTIYLLEEYAKKIGVKFLLNEKLIEYSDKLIITDKQSFRYDRLIFATGGSASPKFGTDGSIFNILKKHNYNISDLKAGLCPIKTKEKLDSISGLRNKCEATVMFNDGSSYSESGEVLFKDDGLSGIVIFNASSIISRHSEACSTISLNLYPSTDAFELENKFLKLNKANNNFMYGLFHKKLANYLLDRLHINVKNFYTEKEIKNIAHLVQNLTFNYDTNYEFENAEVTIGGIEINEISTKFQSKKEPTVYFVGEVLDADGLCGGYNLMWCYISSYLCISNLY